MHLDQAQILQIILGFLMFVVTLVLAWITWKYMKETRRMADDMDIQSKIMQREFELRISPIIDVIFQSSTMTDESGDYKYAVANHGHHAVTLKKIVVHFRHIIDPTIQFPSTNYQFDKTIGPRIHEFIKLHIGYVSLNKVLHEGQSIAQISMQPTFSFENVEGKLFDFKSPERSVR